MEPDFAVMVMDDPDYEDLIAEVTFQGEAVAVLTQDNGFSSIDVQLLQRLGGACWNFKLDAFCEALSHAKTRLWELRKQ
jgi:hypothetical protein